jgi:hypothetical protein
MIAIHEQLVRDHVGQLIRDARRADRAKLARTASAGGTADRPGRPGTRQFRRCDPATPQPA